MYTFDKASGRGIAIFALLLLLSACGAETTEPSDVAQDTATMDVLGNDGAGSDADAGCTGATCPCETDTTCDDNDGCTVDSCDATKKICAHKPKDCDDGDACTTDSCDPSKGDCVHAPIDGCGASKIFFETKFPCDDTAWKADAKSSETAPFWAVDAAPASPAAKSPKCSLNFNNGTNFDCPDGDKTVAGQVLSPEIDLSKADKEAAIALTFWLAGKWESGSKGDEKYDSFELHASSDGKEFKQLGAWDSPADWSLITVSLADYVGGSVWLRFRFATLDCVNNATAGAFIDDLKIADASCKTNAECDDHNPCTLDACDSSTKLCQHGALPGGKVCDDGNKCTENTKCNSAGQCAGTTKACDPLAEQCVVMACKPETGACEKSPAGKGAPCNDGNQCTVSDMCDSKQTCAGKAKSDGALCSDATACVVDATCKSGACSGGVADVNGASCTDGSPCTKGDLCTDGKCVSGKDNGCDDNNPCTKDSCEASKTCKHQAAADKTKCDDGNPCSEPSACAAGKCEAGKAKADGGKCDDAKPCTTGDKCAAGKCAGTAAVVGTACDDGNVCSKADKCDFQGGCIGTSVTCNDGETCTLDKCHPATGKCAHADRPDGASCSDGASCTQSDKCVKAKCQGTKKANGSACSDGNTCTTGDKCDSGACKGVPAASKNGQSCSDDDPCTLNTTCDGGKCKGDKVKSACDDNNPCTLDSCTPTTDVPPPGGPLPGGPIDAACDYKPTAEGATCDDGDNCSSASACKKGQCLATKSDGCTDIFKDTFTCGKDGGWKLQPTADDAKKVVGWAVDGTPSVPAAHSDKCSLNFNNGVNYNHVDDKGTATKIEGTATSPAVDLPSSATIQMGFWSYHGVESSDQYDLRYVEISTDSFSSVAKSVTIPNSQFKNVWHRFTLDLSSLAGKTVKFRFRFDSKDAVQNNTPGWFVDDVVIQSVK
ncbi:MAG: hypothetical protein KC502_08725 [Myxococcales bacterium]|nr:hypothetical protein [Myxococcales bacterium]